MHVLRDCSKARRIWTMLAIYGVFQQNDDNIHQWLQRHCTGSASTMCGAACWTIWRSKNMEVFEDKEWTPWYLINQIHVVHDMLTRYDTSTSTKAHLPRLHVSSRLTPMEALKCWPFWYLSQSVFELESWIRQNYLWVWQLGSH